MFTTHRLHQLIFFHRSGANFRRGILDAGAEARRAFVMTHIITQT
jgi:hypothetical protein